MLAKTYLLYSDNRVDLKKEALIFSEEIFKNLNIKILKKDIFYYENIKIDNVRDIISTASQSSYSGIKIFILNLENIRNEAINALLKIIEEPCMDTYFILLVKKLSLLPKTIISRAIKKYVKSKKYKIDSKIYDFFDGNNLYLDEYIEKNLDISKYKINDILEIKQNLLAYLDDSENIENKIKYELSIRYIINMLKFEKINAKLELIENIKEVYSNKREEIYKFLTRILILSKNVLTDNQYIYLVRLKNSIKNNVSIKSCIYIFFNILLEV
ncbi:hypothetical protein [Sneathia sanguinegens]|uniref:hypothetical protein n=1 Tax=Sneathia sanguinegens TaxID=40543 RepID=UPI0023F817F6|nr:hypothetical protein [Sneathia sanguinegens]